MHFPALNQLIKAALVRLFYIVARVNGCSHTYELQRTRENEEKRKALAEHAASLTATITAAAGQMKKAVEEAFIGDEDNIANELKNSTALSARVDQLQRYVI